MKSNESCVYTESNGTPDRLDNSELLQFGHLFVLGTPFQGNGPLLIQHIVDTVMLPMDDKGKKHLH